MKLSPYSRGRTGPFFCARDREENCGVVNTEFIDWKGVRVAHVRLSALEASGQFGSKRNFAFPTQSWAAVTLSSESSRDDKQLCKVGLISEWLQRTENVRQTHPNTMDYAQTAKVDDLGQAMYLIE